MDSPASRTLNSDGSHQISMSGQGVQNGRAAILLKPPNGRRRISHTLPLRASGASNPDSRILGNDEWIEACRDIGPEILAASQKVAGKADINDETSGTIEAIGA